jgi:putative nucleotidyltransferase with HDIG domain
MAHCCESSMLKREPILSRIIVGSGSYVTSKGERAILEAYLGTCVGVTLCDRQVGVGGLIHLLLPEPTSKDTIWRPEAYASTGLPLFIQHLRKEGARKENLEACVAGGALVGTLSHRDLVLDIGGRTADVVEQILRHENITVRKSEIGGYFCCSLSLNLQNWEVDIAPSGISTVVPGRSDFERPGSKQFDLIIESVSPIPQIALKVVRMISDQNYGIEDVAHEIKQDQVMSAKVIRFCNSVFSGNRTRVDSIERALLIIGEKWLLQLVVGAAMEGFLSQPEGGYSLCKGGLFHHSCGTAAVAKSLARFTGRTPPDLAYTAGLLHDIGKVVLDQYMGAARSLFYRHVQAEDIDLIQAERELFGMTHPEAGKRLATHWSIPETLTDVIQHHHQPDQAAVGSELTHLVYLADLIMSRFVVGQELEKQNHHAFASSLDMLGLRTDQLPSLIDKALCEMPVSPWV